MNAGRADRGKRDSPALRRGGSPTRPCIRPKAAWGVTCAGGGRVGDPPLRNRQRHEAVGEGSAAWF